MNTLYYHTKNQIWLKVIPLLHFKDKKLNNFSQRRINRKITDRQTIVLLQKSICSHVNKQ